MSHILIVEDEHNIRLMVSVLLKQEGNDVVQAVDGHSALAVLDLDPQFDLIITNLQMPGMSGIRLIAQLHQFFPQIPLLVMSGYSEESAAQTLQESYAFLPKPFSRQQLLNAVTDMNLA